MIVTCFNCGAKVDVDQTPKCPRCGQCATGTCG